MASRRNKFDEAYLWNVHDLEVEKLCRYITDDGGVAAYFGISRERVAAIRANMPDPKKQPKRFLDKRSEPLGTADGNGTALKAQSLAQEASAQMLERLRKLYRNFGDRHGISPDEAKVVQLYGWATLHKLKAQAA